MLVLKRVSDYVLIVNKLKELGINFPMWECVKRLKNGNLKTFFIAEPCVDEDLRRQSFERRRVQAWRSFLRLLDSYIQHLSDNNIKTLVEKMAIVFTDLNEFEKLLLQLINVSPEITLEKIKYENCVKECDIEYGNHTKLTQYLAYIGPPSSVIGTLLGLGVPFELILLISLALVALVIVIFLRDRKRRRSYKACIKECYKENHVVRLSEGINYLVNRLNYLVNEISRLLGTNSSSAITERVAYSGYRT
jgi:hypothetical protein